MDLNVLDSIRGVMSPSALTWSDVWQGSSSHTSMLLNLSNTQPRELLYDEHQAARKLNKTGVLLKFYSHLPQ